MSHKRSILTTLGVLLLPGLGLWLGDAPSARPLQPSSAVSCGPPSAGGPASGG
jgi:hypothetical protein